MSCDVKFFPANKKSTDISFILKSSIFFGYFLFFVKISKKDLNQLEVCLIAGGFNRYNFG